MDIDPHLVSDRCAVGAVFKEEFYDVNISIPFNFWLGELGWVMEGSLAFLQLPTLVRPKVYPLQPGSLLF